VRRARQLRWVQIAVMIASLPLARLGGAAAWPACMVVLVLVGFAREFVLEQQIRELASQQILEILDGLEE
jgi:hypothetical protein